MRELFLRADANEMIGLGHVVRSLSLGAMFTSRTSVSLYTVSPSVFIVTMARSLGIQVIALDTSHPESSFHELIDGNQVVVIDGYDYSEHDEIALRDKGANVVTISDGDRSKVRGHVLINHGINAENLDYTDSPECLLLLGPRYALLRPDVLVAAQTAQQTRCQSELKVVVCFGGADPLNLSCRYMEMLGAISIIEEIIVVVGPEYQHIADLRFKSEKVQCACRIASSIEASKLTAFLLDADLAIVPCSGILLEALALKTAVMTGHYVANQRMIAEYIKTKDLLLCVGDLTRAQVSQKTIQNALSEKYRKDIVDGESKDRIRSALNPLF